jgi:hypothetical protein
MGIVHLRQWLLVCLVLTAAAAASAQDNGRRIFEEELRVQLDEQQAAAKQMGLDGGGWFSFNYFKYDDDTNRERDLTEYDLRLWASLSLNGVHTFYIRGVGGYEDWRPDTSQSQFDDPKVERAFYKFDFNRLIRNQTGQNPPVGFTAQVGRDYYVFGSGLALAQTMDAVDLSVNAGDWKVRALLGKFLGDWTNPIDNSSAVEEENHRCLWGFEARYKGLQDHEPFAYFFQTHDNNDIHTPGQDYSYDSRYLGVGSTGKFLLKNLRYVTEFVYEGGQSAAFHSTGQEDIQAFGLDAMLEYLCQTPLHPRFVAEYLWGTGDPDRQNSSGTILGNKAGTTDKAFNAFGFRDTGLAFAPRLSNLHIFEFGGSFFPLENVAFFRKMEVGTRSYLYVKDSTNGGLSDLSANQSSNYAGFEQDVFIDYRITSDVSVTVRYGIFTPGTAFNSREIRNAFLTGLVYSF